MRTMSRLVHARTTIAHQRRMLRRLQAEREQAAAEARRLHTILTSHPDQRARMLAAHPDEAKQMAVKFHDRCLELTRANAAKRCAVCDETEGQRL